mmetsp:Transcript_1901/g.5273  ORF Transcript_1901/g.5273 Transcript_1901/m.5273 type:complete len:227 (-) Transcript_1901:169-849(-)
MEAHASDEWPMPVGNKCVDLPQPKTLEKRIEVARGFQQETSLSWPLLVDTIDNHFLHAFAASPERFFIVVDGVIAYVSFAETHSGHPVDELRRELDAIVSGRKIEREPASPTSETAFKRTISAMFNSVSDADADGTLDLASMRAIETQAAANIDDLDAPITEALGRGKDSLAFSDLATVYRESSKEAQQSLLLRLQQSVVPSMSCGKESASAADALAQEPQEVSLQ